MVDRRSLRSTSKHAEPHWWYSFSRQRTHLLLFYQTEAGHKEQYWGWAGWRSRHSPQSTVDKIFPRCTRLQTTWYNSVPGQPQCHHVGRKWSSSKRTRHINIRFFFVKDVVERGDIKIEYEPTEVMVADNFTKPLQGAAFKKFRDIIISIRG